MRLNNDPDPREKKHTIIIVQHFNTLPVRVSSRNLIYDA